MDPKRLNPFHSLLFRLIVSTFLATIFVLGVFYFLMIGKQREMVEKNYVDTAIFLAKSFESTITKREELENVGFLYGLILKTLYTQNNIDLININKENNGRMIVYLSSESNLIGEEASLDNFYSLKDNRIRTARIIKNERPFLKVVVPISLAGQTSFTYEIFLSLVQMENYFNTIRNYFIIALFSLVGTLLFILLSLSKILIFDPLNELKKAMELVGRGDFKVRLKRKRKDEMEEIFAGFNKMVELLDENYQRLKEAQKELEEKVKERTRELEEAKMSLEIRVAAKTRDLRELTQNLEKIVQERTKELEQSKKELEAKVKELEKFQKLVEGRELKMMEMKKTIQELEEKLKQK